ncbi:hypothetical protein C0J52_02788 [Blattella germanica]|nr:hypothetical protein C0J52_02788 [Blattella germanica]
MLIKCLPIVSLVVFVLLHGMSLGDEYTFSRRILTGLLFSCLGDALLVWPHYFLHGMAAFGVAQVMYTAAFGFKPLNATLGAALYLLCATGSTSVQENNSRIFKLREHWIFSHQQLMVDSTNQTFIMDQMICILLVFVICRSRFDAM